MGRTSSAMFPKRQSKCNCVYSLASTGFLQDMAAFHFFPPKALTGGIEPILKRPKDIQLNSTKNEWIWLSLASLKQCQVRVQLIKLLQARITGARRGLGLRFTALWVRDEIGIKQLFLQCHGIFSRKQTWPLHGSCLLAQHLECFGWWLSYWLKERKGRNFAARMSRRVRLTDAIDSDGESEVEKEDGGQSSFFLL